MRGIGARVHQQMFHFLNLKSQGRAPSDHKARHDLTYGAQQGHQTEVSRTTETSQDPTHNANQSNDMVGKSTVVGVVHNI